MEDFTQQTLQGTPEVQKETEDHHDDELNQIAITLQSCKASQEFGHFSKHSLPILLSDYLSQL